MGLLVIFSQLRRAFLLLRQRNSVQSRETSRYSTPRATLQAKGRYFYADLIDISVFKIALHKELFIFYIKYPIIKNR